MWEIWDPCTYKSLLFFQGFGTFHDKEQNIPAPNTRLVAPAKPTQQGKHQWHNYNVKYVNVKYEVINCPPFKKVFPW